MLMPSFKSLLSSILLAGSVALAQTDGPYSLGLAAVNVETGVLNTTLTCQVNALGFLNLGNQSIGFGVAANLPGRVNISQPFTVTAGTRLIVPKSLSSLAGLFGAKYYAGTVDSVVLNTAGASTASVDAAKGKNVKIPTSPLNSNGVSVLEVPGNGNSLTVGPIVANKAGNVILSFGQILATVTTLDKNQKATFITAKVTCPAQSRPVSLAGITVGGSGSKAQVNPQGVGPVPTIPQGITAGVTGFNYFCDFSGFVQGNVRVSLGGVKPSNTAVKSGGKITLSQGQGNIILSDDLVSQITAIVSTADHSTITLTTFNLVATNATPSKQNILPDGGITVTNVPIQAGATITVPADAPASTLPDINFTAGKSGTTAFLSIADAAGNASLRDADDNEILAIDFTCAALNPLPPVFPYDIA
ncbi:hypothetical protein OC846_006057 [Tilletia horrida]|uniref:Uncharacterized protein n=1 Tax=Tilletia horrida TaxID=155126 RepID=A0AAN6JNZ1_9BASI|nr:hypothetical protein OC846_006057 [Tilletia horrida]KAK0544738.1 hypothetical protein OC845_005448 [Tilletia horrida]KAK0568716.1 hypothetical protein OC861_001644 [Tilletia horrida]